MSLNLHNKLFDAIYGEEDGFKYETEIEEFDSILASIDKKLLNQPNSDGNYPLHAAVDSRDLSNPYWFEICEKLLEAGASPDCQDAMGSTPLHLYLLQTFDMLDFTFDDIDTEKMLEEEADFTEYYHKLAFIELIQKYNGSFEIANAFGDTATSMMKLPNPDYRDYYLD
jgi:hypothetical protein